MTRHLGMQVSAYVDGRLDAQATRAFDQHLVACQVCRHAAEQERRILTSLRTGATPGLSEGLQSMLLALAAPAAAQDLHGGPAAIPAAPRAIRQLRVPIPTVAPAAPALHRSPRRAAMLAGLAAGASAAAAIGLAVAGPGTVGPSPTRQPVARVPGSVSITADNAAFLTSRLSSPAPIPETAERGGR